MNKAQELLNVLDRYYTDLPNGQIGYMYTVIQGLADNCPIGDELLEPHTVTANPHRMVGQIADEPVIGSGDRDIVDRVGHQIAVGNQLCGGLVALAKRHTS